MQFQTCQSSIINRDTRPNSVVLCVTSVRLLANAVAAINRSFGPIGEPFAAKSARIRPYQIVEWQ